MMKLSVGDKVALIAPASGQKQCSQLLIDKAIDILTSWGLEVIITPSITSASRYLAASDTIRSDSLINALTHPEIKAIFSTRGGYGCARLLSYLSDADSNISSPRMLLGFSDLTTLHLHFTRHMTSNVQCVHAPNVATESFLGVNNYSINNQQALHQFLFEGYYPDVSEHLAASVAAKYPSISDIWQTQQKTGGCLSLLVTSLGTDHEIVTNNKWLFIEEVGETPYKIDRMLMHLKNAGKFENVRGVVIGDFVSCNSANINVYDVIAEFAEEFSFPFITLPCWGHGSINLPWVYG